MAKQKTEKSNQDVIDDIWGDMDLGANGYEEVKASSSTSLKQGEVVQGKLLSIEIRMSRQNGKESPYNAYLLENHETGEVRVIGGATILDSLVNTYIASVGPVIGKNVLMARAPKNLVGKAGRTPGAYKFFVEGETNGRAKA